MTSNRVEEQYFRGELNRRMRYLELAAADSPEVVTRRVDHLRKVIVAYSRMCPWPPDQDNPDGQMFVTRLFEDESADFHRLVERGQLISLCLPDSGPLPDCEAQIEERCLESLRAYEAGWKRRYEDSPRALVDYLAGHVGEKPTRKQMSEATGAPVEYIRVVINDLVDEGLLEIDGKRFIVRIDAEGARHRVNKRLESYIGTIRRWGA